MLCTHVHLNDFLRLFIPLIFMIGCFVDAKCFYDGRSESEEERDKGQSPSGIHMGFIVPAFQLRL